MSSMNCYILVSLNFYDQTLSGARIADVADYYRPLLKLQEDFLTSCVFDSINGGTGVVELGRSYEAILMIRCYDQIEAYLSSSIHKLLPEGRELEIVTLAKIVARARVIGILEPDIGR